MALLPRLLRYPLHCAVQIFGWARGLAAFAWSHLEQGPQILSQTSGDGAPERLGPRVVVFCHFDARGRVRDHTRAYLDALRAEALDIVFVSNAGYLAAADMAWLRGRVARIIVRRNIGYDFAAWRDALQACALPAADTSFLLIANDSVYGPLQPLGAVLQQIDFDQADVWSATDSWQHRFHLQSFFLAVGPRALQHEAFAAFWRSVGNVRSKWWVVIRFEVGLTRAMLTAGLRCRALWPYTQSIAVLRQAEIEADALQTADSADAVVPPRLLREPFAKALRDNSARILGAALQHTPLNPTADLWNVLIRQGCPFLKRELLRDNPSGVPDLAAWSSLVAGIDTGSHELILRDLELSLKNRSP
jgi:hypothetical protein